MGMLGWVMMGLAIWHFTIFLPDRFWGGIVGAFVGSLVGAIVVGLIIYGVKVSAFRVPGEKATDIAVVLYAVPGALIGIAARLPRGHPSRTRRTPSRLRLAGDSSRARRRAVPSHSGRSVAGVQRTRFEISAVRGADVERLERELGVSGPLAQVLVRRGLRRAARARAFLAADEEHPPDAFAGIEQAVEPILAYVRSGERITIHGDYDVDGVCSTAVLVRSLRADGSERRLVPARPCHRRIRAERGHVRRLAARGTRLLVTVDCAITAVEEVAAAMALGMEVVVTDHHAPRADGVLPQAPIVHPRCADTHARSCARQRSPTSSPRRWRSQLRGALRASASWRRISTWWRWRRSPTWCRSWVRIARSSGAGCARWRAPPSRAARADGGREGRPGQGQRALGRLRAGAAAERGRAHVPGRCGARADPDRSTRARAAQIAEELDRANDERRHVERRIRFEAEAQIAALRGALRPMCWRVRAGTPG